jgi:predicted TIM-barrel fold metal-dependent hydrolase
VGRYRGEIVSGTPYTLISADCHAGASHDTYRTYLEAKYLDEFDAWRAEYRNPFRDLQGSDRDRSWNSERRNAELESQGIVGEVIFPNTVPPFFPSMALMVRPPSPEKFELRLAGIRAHNRWLADWCAEYPERRAGIGQIFLNDVDEAVADVRWIAEHGLRGGILLPSVPPDTKHVEPLFSPSYDPLWGACEELGVVVNSHSGSGLPNYGAYPATPFVALTEMTFFTHRTLVHMLVSGVFERFPGLRFVVTEQGASWIPSVLEQLDGFHAEMSRTGRVGELRFDDQLLGKKPSEYFAQSCWVGASFPAPPDAAAIPAIGLERFMWGADYPHLEGTYPYTRESLRRTFCNTAEADLRKILAGNIAPVYGFDLDALAPLAAKVGPTPDELAVPLDAVPADSVSPAFTR